MATDQNALGGANLLDAGLDALTAPDDGQDPWEAEERRLQEELDARMRAQRDAQAARMASQGQMPASSAQRPEREDGLEF